MLPLALIGSLPLPSIWTGERTPSLRKFEATLSAGTLVNSLNKPISAIIYMLQTTKLNPENLSNLVKEEK